MPPDIHGSHSGRAELLDILREHAALLVLTATYVGAGLALGVTHVTPRSVGDFSQSLLLQLSAILGTGVVAVTLLRARLRVRAADGSRLNGWRGWAEAWRTERHGPLSSKRVGGFLLVLLVLPLFARAFIGWKAAIPSFNPFSWDPLFAAWDAALHGGGHPWQILQPLLGRSTIGTFSALSGGIVVGLLITPLIASISEDSMSAVPRGMREGAYAMGATKFEVVRKVVFPAAISGIMASIILATSRAIGETMAVVLAAGGQPQLTLDPTESVQTMTASIIQISTGDTPQGSIQFKSLFAVAATLFTLTLALNLISNWVVRRFRTAY